MSHSVFFKMVEPIEAMTHQSNYLAFGLKKIGLSCNQFNLLPNSQYRYTLQLGLKLSILRIKIKINIVIKYRKY